MKKLPNTNKTLILTIICTLIVSLFFGSLVYAFADKVGFDNKMINEEMKDEGRQRGNDKRQDGPQGRSDSEFNGNPDSKGSDSNEGPDSDKNFGSKGDSNEDNSKDSSGRKDENISIGEIKSIENNTVKIALKTRGKDDDSQSEEKSYTVSSDVDLSTFAVGDNVRFEADDNNQITSMIKVDSKDHLRSQDQNTEENKNSEPKDTEQKDSTQTNFSTSV